MVYLFNSNDVELVESYGKFKLCSMPDDEVARFKHDVAKKEEVDMEMMDKFNLFTYLKISHHPLGWDEILKIDSSDKSNVMSILKNKKYTHVVEIKTSNLNSVRLDNTKVEANKPIMSYHADDEFNDRYGPFEKVEDIDLTKMTFNESGKSELRSTMRIIKVPNGGLQYIT